MYRKRARFLLEVVIHVFFWIGVYYVLRALTVSSFEMVAKYNDRGTMSIAGYRQFPYSRIVLGALMLLFYGNVFWLFPRVLKSKWLGMAAITSWAILLFVLNYEVISLLMSRAVSTASRHNPVLKMPIGLPAPSPRPFSPNDWTHMQLVMVAIFFSILSIAGAYFFIREWIQNDLKRSREEAQQLDAEIRFLRSQVNPHFLFNTLNNLFSMAQRRGHEELAGGISKLSGMMRYMIYESNTNTVPLQQEIAYLQDCIALNKLRYADSEVSVCFRHPEPSVIMGVQVAPMLLIPFLENAFKHGVSIGHHSSLIIVIEVDQKKLIFSCENPDNSAVKKMEEGKGGIGLENVRRRLELVYSGRYELRAGPEGRKYKVNLQIDLA